MILGLDFGNPTGIIVIRWNGHLVERRTLVLDGSMERNVYDVYYVLHELIQRLEISVVAYEDINYVINGTAALQMQARYKAIVMLLCQAHQIPFACVASSQIKKIATGKGNWSKGTKAQKYKDKKSSAEVKQMIQKAAARRLSLSAVQEDVAMALFAAEFVRVRVGRKQRMKRKRGLQIELETDLFHRGA